MDRGISTERMTCEGAQRVARDLTHWAEVSQALERELQLPSFLDAVAFTNRVAEMAEVAQHHPSTTTCAR